MNHLQTQQHVKHQQAEQKLKQLQMKQPYRPPTKLQISHFQQQQQMQMAANAANQAHQEKAKQFQFNQMNQVHYGLDGIQKQQELLVKRWDNGEISDEQFQQEYNQLTYQQIEQMKQTQTGAIQFQNQLNMEHGMQNEQQMKQFETME